MPDNIRTYRKSKMTNSNDMAAKVMILLLGIAIGVLAYAAFVPDKGPEVTEKEPQIITVYGEDGTGEPVTVGEDIILGKLDGERVANEQITIENPVQIRLWSTGYQLNVTRDISYEPTNMGNIILSDYGADGRFINIFYIEGSVEEVITDAFEYLEVIEISDTSISININEKEFTGENRVLELQNGAQVGVLSFEKGGAYTEDASVNLEKLMATASIYYDRQFPRAIQIEGDVVDSPAYLNEIKMMLPVPRTGLEIKTEYINTLPNSLILGFNNSVFEDSQLAFIVLDEAFGYLEAISDGLLAAKEVWNTVYGSDNDIAELSRELADWSNLEEVWYLEALWGTDKVPCYLFYHPVINRYILASTVVLNKNTSAEKVLNSMAERIQFIP
jgi:hypothetical protein